MRLSLGTTSDNEQLFEFSSAKTKVMFVRIIPSWNFESPKSETKS